VQAIRTLEQLDDRMTEQAGARRNQVAPGLVVIIGHPDGRAERIIATPVPAMIEARPIEADEVEEAEQER
jgi:hypothetical protein